MKAGENLKAQLQKQLEKAQQEFDRLLEMSLELDESTPFLDDKLRKLSEVNQNTESKYRRKYGW